MNDQQQLTLCSIPANARAVYAPREKPTLRLVESIILHGVLTEKTNLVTRSVVIHQEFVALHDMFV